MIASRCSRCTPAGSFTARWQWIAVLLVALGVITEEASAQSVAWTARKNGTLADGEARPGSGDSVVGKRALAVDGSGNVFVTGYSFNGLNNDYLTVAYDTAGNVLWSKLKNGAGNNTDQAYALAVDGSGNVYVTGRSSNSSNEDFLTVAYDSAGTEVWAKAKNGSANNVDVALALAADGSGNVYVTGYSYNGTNYDCLTVAYDSAGTELWARLKNGAANRDDMAYALAVDGSGNVYVVGQSYNGANYDYLTVAYDSAGAELWARVKNGAANNSDSALALAVDGSGNVYLTGQSYTGTHYDWLTVAYDSAGTELWAKVKNGAANSNDLAYALAVDGSGTVYVTGKSSNGANYDYLTVAYDSSGTELWAKVMNGAASNTDEAFALAVDGSGNVYVAGFSSNGSNNDYLTVAYDSSGIELWAKVRNGAANNLDQAYALAVDGSGSGNVYVTGYSSNGSNNDYLTVAYDSAGTELWTAKEPPQVGYDDRPGSGDPSLGKSSLAVDGSGNVYVTGNSSNGANFDYMTVAYDSAGTQLWAKVKNGTANNQDQAYALAVDGGGNVYVTGHSYNGTNYDYLTVAYDSTGTELWAKLKNGAPNNSDYAYALAVDGSGNVYVTGQSYNGANYDYMTVAYDSAGTELWAKVKNGAANSSDSALALALDGSGNVYVTGQSHNGTNYDYLTVAYDSAGTELWAKAKNGAPSNQDFAYALALDGSGNVYVTGQSANGANTDYLTVAYDSAGTELWAKMKNGVANNSDSAFALAVAGSGNVYVTGFSSNGSNLDYLTVAYDSAGTELWAKVKNGAANNHDETYALALDGSGNVYVTGRSSNGSNFDYLTVAYDSAGTELWQYIYNGGGEDSSYIAVVSGNALYVSGYSAGQQNDFFTVKFSLASDTTAPSDPAIGPTSPPEAVWTNDNTVEVSWSGAADEVGGSGLAGYSIEWNTTSPSTPDTVVDVVHGADPHSTTSPPLAEGTAHYFHLRTCDLAGNCTSTIHRGPYDIDLTSPSIPGGVSSSTHVPGIASTEGELSVTWGAATDALSGVAGYSWALDSNPTWSCEQVADGDESITSATFLALSDGSYYLHVCAVDEAGNWGLVRNAGPYVVSLAAPSSDLFVYYSRVGAGEIRRVRANGLDDSLVLGSLSAPVGLAVDPRGGKIYVALAGTNAIARCNLDGTGLETLVSSAGGPYGVALDVDSGKIYWAARSAGEIRRANLDGTGVDSVLTALHQPTGVAFDRTWRKVYWSEDSFAPAAAQIRLGRSEPDGSGMEVLLTLPGATNRGYALDVDPVAQKVYWVNTQVGGGTVRVLNYDGTGDAALVSGLAPAEIEIDPSSGHLFWSEEQSGTVRRAAFDGSSPVTLSSGGNRWGTSLLIPESPPVAFAQVLSVPEDGQVAVRLRAYDPDNDALSWSVSLQPAHGTLSGTAPELIYTPAPDFIGSDFFEFQVDDSISAPAIATIAISVTAVDEAPTDPTSLSAMAPHVEGGWSNQPAITMIWSGAADDSMGSGVDGYSVEWDVSPISTPDAALEVDHSVDPHSFGAALTEGGGHYFHLRTCDNGGNCTSTLHAGPFLIDTGAPSGVGAVASTSHSTPSSAASLVTVWSAASDGLSGVAGYSVAVAASAVPGLCSGAFDEAAATATRSPGEGSWYVHVCAVDLAGNTGPVAVGGPFVIDATPPSTPGAVSSASHDGGSTNDPTIDVEWGASSDGSGSGVASYRYGFGNSASPPTCAALGESTAGTSASSSTLATGTWYLHVCAVDAAGNKSAVTSGGAYTVDLSAPKVSNVDSVASSGGAIGEGEVVNVGITQLLVSFDEAMAATLAEATSSYLLVASGIDGAIDTAACGPLQGDDQSLSVDGATYAGQTSTLTVNGSTALEDGNYRLLVCASLADVAGNPLDGDGNGAGGDDFARSFRVDLARPTVTLVQTVADTGDGALGENEATNVAITALLVSFSEEVLGGDSTASYLLVEAGVDGTLDTAACGPLAGDDASVTIDSAVYASLGSTSTLSLSGGAVLPDGVYRLLVCGTVTDLGGNALDDDDDDDGNDDFERSFIVDTIPPTNPTAISSATHPYAAWSQATLFTALWSGATDELSGLAGYSVVMDGNPSGSADTSLEAGDTAGSGTLSTTLGEGAWYVHVRACDNAGNCAVGVAEDGFWGIDTSAPTAPGAVSSSSHDPAGTPVSDDTIDVAWGAATDTFAGVASYSYAFDGNPTGSCVGSSTASLAATSGALTDGAYYVHVCAVDFAGNSGAAVHGGPYVVDTAGPTGLVVSSSSHTVSTWSNDSSIDFLFSGASDANGVSGYAVVYDQTTGTEPACTTTQAASTFTGSSSPDGDQWWIHVRALDAAGNCGDAVHFGAFWIDTAAPSAPGTVISSSHDGGPTNDTTIDVGWGAATDALSGIDGYSFFFNGVDEDCDGTMDGDFDERSAISPPLAAGTWYFHVCAADLAGNWGAVTTGGPYTIDLSAPKVTNLDSFASSGGAIGESEVVNVGITQLLVSFDEAMEATLAESLGNYLLLFGGNDGTLDTTVCGPLQGDDQSLSVDSAVYAGQTSTISVNGATALTDGTYRLLVCASLADVAGNPLDGNGDGSSGDDFARSFRVDLTPPTVALVNTVADTGDGALTDLEPTNVAITELLVSFDEEVVGGDDLESFLLVEGGLDGVLETSACGPLAGDDASVAIDSAVHASLTSTLALNGGAALPDGEYRLLVCATLTDLGGNALDGDDDGDGHDDFARTFTVDTVPPTNPTAISSSTHVLGAWSSLTGFSAEWSGGADDRSGLAGASVVIDGNSNTAVDCTIEVAGIAGTGSTAATLGEGAWYVHVRLRDRAGNCATGEAEAGFWGIDTSAPGAPGAISSSSHDPVSTAVSDPTIDVAWGAASDGLSGIAGYSFHFSADDDEDCDGTMDSPEDERTALSPSLADGSWYFHVCAVDLAGNAGPTTHGGPWIVDTTPPAGLAVSSSSHAVSTWSNDASVDFGFSGANDANGVAGYAVEYDQATGTEPACTTTQAASTFTGSSSPDGNHWWIHVRARDTAGNCGATVHLGPFWIDTVAPGTVSGLVSTDHAVGLASIDPTIAMSWSAAIDDRSGVAGYSVQFSSSASSTCDGSQETASTSFASAALAHGDWFVQVCARDVAGNWGAVTQAGPYTVDLVAPQVVLVDSVAATPDNQLSEGETTGLAITQLRVTFGEGMSTSVSLPSSYRLIAAGSDGFQTVSCAGGVSAQDLAVAIDAVSSLGGSTYGLAIHGGTELPTGDYRLLACASLTDAAGNHLDGNGDTVADDDFVRSFTIDRSPPTVTLVETTAPTSGAGLDEDEATNVALTTFAVTFSEAVYDPIGDTHPDDVTNPGNYRLLAAGGDGFQTLSCQAGVAPADVALVVDGVVYDAPTRTATLAVNGGLALGEEHYRLYVCGSAAIIDLVGLPLDGDGDGSGGDDFVRHFQVDTTAPSNPAALAQSAAGSVDERPRPRGELERGVGWRLRFRPRRLLGALRSRLRDGSGDERRHRRGCSAPGGGDARRRGSALLPPRDLRPRRQLRIADRDRSVPGRHAVPVEPGPGHLDQPRRRTAALERGDRRELGSVGRPTRSLWRQRLWSFPAGRRGAAGLRRSQHRQHLDDAGGTCGRQLLRACVRRRFRRQRRCRGGGWTVRRRHRRPSRSGRELVESQRLDLVERQHGRLQLERSDRSQRDRRLRRRVRPIERDRTDLRSDADSFYLYRQQFAGRRQLVAARPGDRQRRELRSDLPSRPVPGRHSESLGTDRPRQPEPRGRRRFERRHGRGRLGRGDRPGRAFGDRRLRLLLLDRRRRRLRR